MTISLWAGTSRGFEDFQQLFNANDALIRMAYEGKVTQRGSSDDPDELDYWGDKPEKIQVVNGVGIISFAGQMVRHETWLTRLLQMPTYEGIKDALTTVASGHEGARIALIDADTPGGLVDGCGGLGRYIAEIDKKVMPVYGYTGAQCCSAGVWIMSNTRRFYADVDTQIGSIGVLAIHQEISRMLESVGVKVNVFRSAPYKSLANRFEPLSKLAKEEIEEEMAVQHGKFVSQIAAGRGLTEAYVAKNIATGKVFDENKALSLKLIDAISSIEVVVQKLSESAAKVSPSASAVPAIKATREATPMSAKRKAVALPQSQIAALAMGAVIPTDSIVVSADVGEAGTETETEQDTAPDAAAAAAAAAETQAAAGAETVVASAAPAAAAPAAAVPDPVVAMLQSQLSEANGRVTALTVELSAATAARDAATAGMSLMEPIVRDCSARLATALGISLVGLDGLSGQQLASQFQTLNEQFQKRFATARVTSPASDVKPAATAQAGNPVTPINRAGLKATGLK